MNITEDYVSFEVAELLKEKKFDGLCYCHEFTDYEGNSTTYHTEYPENWNQSEPCVSIPTLGMAMKWLREVYNIDIIIFHEKLPNDCYWAQIEHNLFTEIQQEPEYKTYEDAVEAALKYTLENFDLNNYDTLY